MFIYFCLLIWWFWFFGFFFFWVFWCFWCLGFGFWVLVLVVVTCFLLFACCFIIHYPPCLVGAGDWRNGGGWFVIFS
jgi:hypothetical protein